MQPIRALSNPQVLLNHASRPRLWSKTVAATSLPLIYPLMPLPSCAITICDHNPAINAFGRLTLNAVTELAM